jgi:hypothetical protein
MKSLNTGKQTGIEKKAEKNPMLEVSVHLLSKHQNRDLKGNTAYAF